MSIMVLAEEVSGRAEEPSCSVARLCCSLETIHDSNQDHLTSVCSGVFLLWLHGATYAANSVFPSHITLH